jgi:hypothetical protein
MIDILRKAQNDAIYAAGAKFGWWGIKRPDRKEAVYDDGIDAFFKKEYLADYYKLYPASGATARSTGVVLTPEEHRRVVESVRRRAYEIWEERGPEEHNDWAHWYQARQELGVPEDYHV